MADNLSKSLSHMVKTGHYKSPDKFKVSKSKVLKSKKDTFKGEEGKKLSVKQENLKGKTQNE